MLDIILISIYFVVALISIKLGVVVFIHLKKFNFLGAEKNKKVFSFFKWITVALFLFGAIILIIILII